MYLLNAGVIEVFKNPVHSNCPFDVDHVMPRIPPHVRIQRIGINHIIALARIDEIGPSPTSEDVTSKSAVNEIIPRITIDRIVPRVSKHKIVGRSAVENVIVRCPVDISHVVASFPSTRGH